MIGRESNIYNDDMFRLALSNTIYHSLNDVIRDEEGITLPILYMYYIEGKVKKIRSYWSE